MAGDQSVQRVQTSEFAFDKWESLRDGASAVRHVVKKDFVLDTAGSGGGANTEGNGCKCNLGFAKGGEDLR